MADRFIVFDPTAAVGTWIFSGTLLSVREVRRDLMRDPDRARIAYRSLGLSNGDLDAALAFAFPPVQDVTVVVHGIPVETHCVCGERRQAIAWPPAMELDPCICGRIWRLPVQIELVGPTDDVEVP